MTDNDHGPQFDIQSSTSTGDVIVLAVRGDLDAFTGPQLSEAITDSLAETPAALVIDLSELDFLGSAGMSVLIVGNDVAGSETRFAVVADGPSTSRPMKTIGLDKELRLYPTLGAALADIG